MVEIVSKPRKKKSRVEVTHAVFGVGKVIERRPTQNGSDALVVRFPEGETRTLLAAERYWIDLDLAAIPISERRMTKDVAQKKQNIAPDGIEPEVEAVTAD